MKSVFFITVFNEIDHLPALLDEVRACDIACDEILVVNSGSTDGSEKLVRESGFPYIDIPENQGANYATILAVDWALDHGFDIVGSISGNGKMLPSEIGTVLSPVLEGKADYVTGSRFLEGGSYINLPEFRRRSIPWVNRFVKLITGAALTDATCGYRAYKLELLRRADFDWHAEWLYNRGYEYYLYAKVILDAKVSWLEVPITSRYPGKGLPYSKIQPGRDWYEMLKPWVVARVDGQRFLPG